MTYRECQIKKTLINFGNCVTFNSLIKIFFMLLHKLFTFHREYDIIVM